jgi:hypothetical protein
LLAEKRVTNQKEKYTGKGKQERESWLEKEDRKKKTEKWKK